MSSTVAPAGDHPEGRQPFTTADLTIHLAGRALGGLKCCQAMTNLLAAMEPDETKRDELHYEFRRLTNALASELGHIISAAVDPRCN